MSAVRKGILFKVTRKQALKNMQQTARKRKNKKFHENDEVLLYVSSVHIQVIKNIYWCFIRKHMMAFDAIMCLQMQKVR